MTYTAEFKGGGFHGGRLNYKKKIGGYIRLTLDTGQVVEYGRIEDHKDRGVYEVIDREV